LVHLGSPHDEIEGLHGKNKISSLHPQPPVDFQDLVGEDDALVLVGAKGILESVVLIVAHVVACEGEGERGGKKRRKFPKIRFGKMSRRKKGVPKRIFLKETVAFPFPFPPPQISFHIPSNFLSFDSDLLSFFPFNKFAAFVFCSMACFLATNFLYAFWMAIAAS
jgi:hypothetical protein